MTIQSGFILLSGVVSNMVAVLRESVHKHPVTNQS